nr:MAG: nonstructural protein [Microvirus sp.]
MSILKIFTVYDHKAKAHLPPFFLPQDGMAERTFSDCCNNPEHQFGAHPEDYTLMSIGEFDESTAIITPTDIPHVHGVGVSFVQHKSPD